MMKILQKYCLRFGGLLPTGCKRLDEAANGKKVDQLNTTAARPELVEGFFKEICESLC